MKNKEDGAWYYIEWKHRKKVYHEWFSWNADLNRFENTTGHLESTADIQWIRGPVDLTKLPLHAR